MATRCPQCGSSIVVVQNFDVLTDTVSMLKLLNRVQLRCESCGWIGFMETPDPV